jgi:hypothetical protein
MIKKRTLWLSLIIGTLIESVVWGVGATFAKFGPCGPGNEAAGILLLLHLPGFTMAKHLLPRGSPLEFPLALILTIAIWSLLAFVIIGTTKSLYAKAKRPRV